MNKEEFVYTQELLLAQARLIAALDLEELLNAIDRAEAVGPVLNPTLYKQGAEKMQAIRRVAEAALKIKNEVLKGSETGGY